jgi:NitT/TauT family transport system substrate-binding protein
MQIIQSRRDFLAGMSVIGAAGIPGAGGVLADEPPLETTTIRIRREVVPNIVNGIPEIPVCMGPTYVAEKLLSAEGFTDIRYLPVQSGAPLVEAFERGEIDFAGRFAPGALRHLDAGVPFTVLAGLHLGAWSCSRTIPSGPWPI